MAQETSTVLSADDIATYEEDGVVCLRGVISDAWLEHLRTSTERVLQGRMIDMSRQGVTGEFVGDLNLWTKDDGFATYAFDGPTWQIAQTLMRASGVRLFGDQLFVKQPGSQAPTPWHHDQPYFCVDGNDICSIWVPMEEVTRETSGLEYVRGSHRWNRHFNPEDFGALSVADKRGEHYESIPDFDAHRDDYEFLNWDMQPGDCLVHHSLTVHGAGGNSSLTQRRRAISTRFIGDRAYFRPTAQFSPEMLGLEPGAPLKHPMFPVVPRNGEPIVPRPKAR